VVGRGFCFFLVGVFGLGRFCGVLVWGGGLGGGGVWGGEEGGGGGGERGGEGGEGGGVSQKRGKLDCAGFELSHTQKQRSACGPISLLKHKHAKRKGSQRDKKKRRNRVLTFMSQEGGERRILRN